MSNLSITHRYFNASRAKEKSQIPYLHMQSACQGTVMIEKFPKWAELEGRKPCVRVWIDGALRCAETDSAALSGSSSLHRTTRPQWGLTHLRRYAERSFHCVKARRATARTPSVASAKVPPQNSDRGGFGKVMRSSDQARLRIRSAPNPAKLVTRSNPPAGSGTGARSGTVDRSGVTRTESTSKPPTPLGLCNASIRRV